MKILAIAILSLIAIMILIIGGYVIYVIAQYSRIEDNRKLSVTGSVSEQVQLETSYTVLSYNVGFGAYSPEYSFFMDTGVMNDGREITGTYAKGLNKKDVQKNVDGQAQVLKSYNADFCFLQEVDERADRSYNINMVKAMRGALPSYSSTYAENFHTAYLQYPFNDPIGTINAGILTLSNYKIDSAVRRSFPVTTSLIDKLFDLDRCFAVHYLPIGGSEKQLVLINLHMSAYDEGGKIRAAQLKMLNGVLAEEYAKGNYVIAGGDFNHCLIADQFDSDAQALQHFPSDQKTPDWVKNSVLHNSELANGFSIAASAEIATCRGAEMPYKKGVNYSTVVDGFIVSGNVTVVSENTIDTDYAFSDHNPVIMEFKLIRN
ncbi:MAG: endonuclease/exonuclease/phosphatase family protein [Clostridiales bacterium]|nr:endonuclease/exonuclease/phosphatase family protein [Clostridiales bacterium]